MVDYESEREDHRDESLHKYALASLHIPDLKPKGKARQTPTFDDRNGSKLVENLKRLLGVTPPQK